MIELGAWAPDLPVIRAPYLRTASGVTPLIDGYGPFGGLSVTTDALTSKCLGAVSARDIDQANHLYAGDSTKLYENEAGVWTDRSRVGGYGPAGDSTRWRWVTYGDRMIAVNGLDEPQYIDMSTAATAFADLAGSPPAAQYIATFLEFVVLGSLTTSGMAIKWSAFADSEGWTPGTGQSDEQEFADGGRITGLAGLDVLYIFQDNAIRRMNYVGGPTIMQIDKLVEGIGCVEPNSLVQWGSMFFFLSEDGFYMFDGQQAQPIGVGAFDKWFQANSNRGLWNRMSSAINPTDKLVTWAFCSSDNVSGTPDYLLIYNWVSKRASVVPYPTGIEFILGAASLGVSIDDYNFDIDAMTISFDDPFFLGGSRYFGGFNSAHKLGSFSGSAVAAILETGDYALTKGPASVEWFRPVTDAPTATVAGAGSMKLASDATYRGAISQQASGRCPQRQVMGNYVRAKVQVPAAADWTFASGVDLKAKANGAR
jgi:hypothetical protein